MKNVLEVCCGSYYDALQAEKGGAERIELNSALNLGGLTPTTAVLDLVKENTGLKVISMVRPRGAGFYYSKEDYEVMKRECRELLEHGSDGIAFGFLNSDFSIDEERTKEFIDIIKSFEKEAVFHRAFDCVKECDEAAEKLISLGADRILTSGFCDKAAQGAENIAYIQKKYGDRIEVLAGSGINYTNAAALIEKTGISQIHSSCKSWIEDKTTTSGRGVTYTYAKENCYEAVDMELVKKIIEIIR